MNDSTQSQQLTRREAVIGVGGLFAGGLGGFQLATTGGNVEESEEWPYWTANWEIETFELRSENEDIQFVLELRNLTDKERVWPGGVWAANQDTVDWIERMPSTRVAPGETETFGPWVDAQRGRYEGGIIGVEEFDTEVTVDG